MIDIHSTPRSLRLLSTAATLGDDVVKSSELDDRLGLPTGHVAKLTGLDARFVHHGSAATLGARAAREALDAADLTIDDIDLVIAASATPDQLLPCNAALLLAELTPTRPVPGWDVNASCLSFMAALDVAASLLQTQRHRRILIVSADVASGGLNWDDLHSAGIFSDGAAAAIVDDGDGSDAAILACSLSTHAQAAHACELAAGGSRHRPATFDGDFIKASSFRMQGGDLLRLAAEHLPRVIDDTLEAAGLTIGDIDLVIPHQASHVAMRWLRPALGVEDDRFFDHYSDHGNLVAGSVPTALHAAIADGRIERGQRVLLVGTGAGVSMGGMVLCF